MKSFLYLSVFLLAIGSLDGLPSGLSDQSKADAINCTPTDGWQTIFTYQNGLSSSVTASYRKTVGTRWESGTPSSADAAAFFKRFGDVLGEKNHTWVVFKITIAYSLFH